MKLPEDFPGHAQLVEAGYTTMHKVETASDEDLLAVEGVGPATLEKIRGYSPEASVSSSDGRVQCSFCSHYFENAAAVAAHSKEEHE